MELFWIEVVFRIEPPIRSGGITFVRDEKEPVAAGKVFRWGRYSRLDFEKH